MVRLKTLLDLIAYGVAVLGFLPLFPYLDAPARLVFPAAVAIGAHCDRRERFPLKPAFTTLLTLGVFLFHATQISREHLVEPAVNLLVLLLAVRLLSAKGGREYLQIFILSLFALAASSLLDLSIAFLAYLAPMILGVTVGLVLLAFYGADPHGVFGRRELRRVLGTALLLPVCSLGLMLLFFFILPRTQRPLWNFLQPEAAASGLSERVEPGTLAATAGGGRPIFRVQTPRLPPGELYWRGIVLNQPDGKAWVRGPIPPEKIRVVGGTPVNQVVFPEPGADTYLPLLDLPQELTGVRHRRDADLVFTTPENAHRTRYEGISRIGARLETAGSVDREAYLRLPERISPRVESTLASVVRPGEPDRETIARLEGFFLGQGLTYSLDAPVAGVDPVEEFLFVTRRGFCEHFATSFALMLRMAGIPARLVGGYAGGRYNALGGYYLVTEEDAHLWVEALVDGREWVRLDPTRLASNAGTVNRGGGLSWSRRLLDTADYYWNRLVITYDLGRQAEIFARTRKSARLPSWRLPDLPAAILLLGGAALGVALLFRAWRGASSREERLLRRYLAAVRRRHGLAEIPPSLGLHELADQVDDPDCHRFAVLYGGAVYRDRPLSDEEFRELEKIVRRLGEREGRGD